MALDFPASPTSGQIYTNAGISWRWDGAKWVSSTGAAVSVLISATPPAFQSGAMWWDNTTGQLFVAYDDGNSQQWVVATNMMTPTTTYAGNVGRNLVHNALFNIQQRGVGPWTTNGYTMDRWWSNGVTDTRSITRNVAGDAGRVAVGDDAMVYQLGNTFTGTSGAGSYHAVTQPIESVRRLSGKTVIVSLYASCVAASMKLGISLDQVFGTGGSPSATVTGAGQAITITPTWARYSVTLTLPSTSSKTLGSNNDDYTGLNLFYSSGANFNIAAGGIGVQSGTIVVWGVQLEIATPGQTQPTPLEKRDPVYELQQCQRFFQPAVCGVRMYATGVTSLSAQTMWPQMRATPTVASTIAGFQGNTSGPYNLQIAGNNSGYFGCVSAATGDSYALNYVFMLTADL